MATDIFVRYVCNIKKAPNDGATPAFGTSYAAVTGAIKEPYPDHKFCWQTEPDEAGNVIRWFLADLPTQQLYNWVYSDQGDWPSITQTFVIPRADYKATPANPETTYPPPPNANFDLTGFAITGTSEVRIGDERLDSLYVAVEVVREKIDTPQSSQRFDPDTGAIRVFTRQKVPAGTPGSTVNESGQYSEVNATNSLWSDKLVEYAPGLAGSAVGGESSRTWRFSLDYYYPPVLDYLRFQVVNEDPGDIFSDVIGYIVTPIWKVDQYNGPCNATMVERWTLNPPAFVAPDKLLPKEIQFLGTSGLNVFVPRSLHQDVVIFENGFVQFYPATTPTYWPASMVVSVDVAPQYNGWLQRIITIDAPSLDGVAPALLLTQTAQDSDSFTLGWTPETPLPATHPTTVNIATSPDFDTGFLPGYQGLVLAAGITSLEVTGAIPGRVYYAQVLRDADVSNIVTCMIEPSAVIQVSRNGITLTSGEDVNAGSIAPGQTNPLTFVVANRGILLLNNLTLSLSGANANQYSLGSLSSTSVPPGGSASFQVTFAPTTGGSKSATVSIGHDGTGPNPFLIDLVGTAVAPILQLEQPLNTVIPSGGSSNFGTFTTAPISKTFYVRNTGSASLGDLFCSISGAADSDYTVTAQPADTTLPPSGLTNFTVEFNPVADDTLPALRQAQLLITNNSETNPFVVNLLGTYAPPGSPGSGDETYVVNVNGVVRAIAMLPDGSAIIGGNFNDVEGVTVVNCAKVGPTGTVDASFTPTPNGTVLALAVQEDGDILIGGNFNQVDGNSQSYLARVDSAGVWDSGYTPAVNDQVRAIAIQADGKAVIGGMFTTVNASSKPYIARLNTGGSTDGAFTTEVDGNVNGIAIQSDGKLLVVGDFPGNLPPPPTTTTLPPPTTTMPPTTTVPPPTTTPPPPTTTPPPTTAPPPTTTPPPTTVPPTTTITPTTTPPPTLPPPTTLPPILTTLPP